jgi:hypothetical protein
MHWVKRDAQASGVLPLALHEACWFVQISLQLLYFSVQGSAAGAAAKTIIKPAVKVSIAKHILRFMPASLANSVRGVQHNYRVGPNDHSWGRFTAIRFRRAIL